MYLLRGFASEGYHFEGHLVDRLDELEYRLEVDIAEADVIAEQARSWRQFATQAKG